MFLRFSRYRNKWYAETPTGELAWADGQGLSEWTRDDNDRPIRTDYTGGDRQISGDGQLWTISSSANTAKIRGFLAAISTQRLN